MASLVCGCALALAASHIRCQGRNGLDSFRGLSCQRCLHGLEQLQGVRQWHGVCNEGVTTSGMHTSGWICRRVGRLGAAWLLSVSQQPLRLGHVGYNVPRRVHAGPSWHSRWQQQNLRRPALGLPRLRPWRWLLLQLHACQKAPVDWPAWQTGTMGRFVGAAAARQELSCDADGLHSNWPMRCAACARGMCAVCSLCLPALSAAPAARIAALHGPTAGAEDAGAYYWFPLVQHGCVHRF